MSQYPVDNKSGLFEAVNYLLSGPAGLGQNFAGFSAYKPAYLTSTYRAPFTVPDTTTPAPLWWVDPIAISNITPINVVDGKTANVEVTFASAQPTAPFAVGDSWGIRNVVESGGESYNGYYSAGQILTCSTTSAIFQTRNQYAWATYVSGGEVYKDQTDVVCSSDANARVSVAGPSDIVFISSQLALNVGIDCTSATNITVSVQINRYKAQVEQKPGAVDYLFVDATTISEQTRTYAVTPTDTEIDCGQNIFTTVLDQPSYGYWWYIAEVFIHSDDLTKCVPNTVTAGLRSLTAQVIKQ
jgi:hypothetical protein